MISFCHWYRIEIRDKIVKSPTSKFATLKQLYQNPAISTLLEWRSQANIWAPLQRDPPSAQGQMYQTRRVTESKKREKMFKISRIIRNNVSVIYVTSYRKAENNEWQGGGGDTDFWCFSSLTHSGPSSLIEERGRASSKSNSVDGDVDLVRETRATGLSSTSPKSPKLPKIGKIRSETSLINMPFHPQMVL